MVQIQWYISKGARPWNAELEDWLSIRTTDGSTLLTVWLEDSPHHQYLQLYVFDKEGQPVVRREELEQGMTELDLTKWADCVVLAKIKFFRYPNNPCGMDDRARPVPCGKVLDNRGMTPIPILLVNKSAGGKKPAGLPLTPAEVYMHFTDLHSPPPRVSLSEEPHAEIPFRLSYLSPFVTRVYLLRGPQAGAPRVPPSGEIAPAALESFKDSVTINTGEVYPRDFDKEADEPTPWQVALPVSLRNAASALVGVPLARKELFDALEVAPLKSVRVSWRWAVDSPTRQMRVIWYEYDQTGWSSEYRKKDVNGTSCVLFDVKSGHKGKWVSVYVIPLLFGQEIPNIQKSDFKKL